MFSGKPGLRGTPKNELCPKLYKEIQIIWVVETESDHGNCYTAIGEGKGVG